MSVARIHTVEKSRKDQGACEKCRTPLPKGSAYRWFSVGYHAKFKHKRCLKHGCFPKPSERESSSKSGIMAAMETFEGQDFDNIDDLQSAFEDVKGAFEEYADECRTAADAWENGNSQLEERADAAEQANYGVEDWEPEDFQGEMDEEGEPEDEEEFAGFLSDQKEAAVEAMNTAEGELL